MAYKVSYALGIIGYIGIVFTILGLNMLILVRSKDALDFSILTFFYGLYFGVVSRDFAEVCSDTMAAHIGVSVHRHLFIFCSFTSPEHGTTCSRGAFRMVLCPS